MDRLQAMQVFVQVVELGTFAAAANALGLHRPAVTLAVQQLERTLDVSLFIRDTRNVNLTPEGDAFYRRCLVLLSDVNDAFTRFSDAPLDPVGRLHIDVSPALADALLIPALPAFKAAFPRIALSIATSDRTLDMVNEGIDCLVRLGSPKPQGLTSQKAGTLPMMTCGAPAYFKQRGVPKRLSDLDKHVAVNVVSGPNRRPRDWVFLENRKETRMRLESAAVTDNSGTALSCALAGLGMIQALRVAVAPHIAHGALVEVLPKLSAPPMDVTVIYPPQARMPTQTRVFIEWLGEMLGQAAGH